MVTAMLRSTSATPTASGSSWMTGAPGCMVAMGSKTGGQHFILDFDQVERGPGDVGRLGGDDGHAVAHVAHLVVERDLIPRMRVGPGLAARSVDDARDILVGQHGMHAGQRPRPAGVDARDAGMGMRAGQQGRVQHAGQIDVIGKNRLALDQLDRIHLHLRPADHVGGPLGVHRGEDDEGNLGLRQHVVARLWQFRLRRAAHGVEEALQRDAARRVDGRHALAAQHGRHAQHRLHGFDVARAATEHAAQYLAHLRFGRVRLGVEQLAGGEHHGWRAIAALDGAGLGKGLLDRVEGGAGAVVERLDGGDRAAVHLGGQQHAGGHQLAVHQHGAGATFAGFAAVFDAPAAGAAEQRHERFAWFDGKGAGLAVEIDLNIHARTPLEKA